MYLNLEEFKHRIGIEADRAIASGDLERIDALAANLRQLQRRARWASLRAKPLLAYLTLRHVLGLGD